MFGKEDRVYGLDAGQSNVRLLELVRDSGGIRVQSHACMNMQAEGIMDDGELYCQGGLGKWLNEKKICESGVCVGVPQYLCTTRLAADIPGSMNDEQLASMLEYETSQLSGLSEEVFLSDCTRMRTTGGGGSPVLMGFCREAVAEELAEKCGNAGIRLSEIAMSGLAVASAFCQLRPVEAQSVEPQLILDMGTDNTTIVVMSGGSVRYTGSLMFGGRRFTQVLAHIEGCGELEAEKLKMSCVPDWESEDGPFRLAVSQLEGELRIAVENWRSNETGELAEQRIGGIWLSGGGVLMPGLETQLAVLYGCRAELFGPVLDGGSGPAPEYVTAYGLGLQQLGVADFPVTLATRLMRWQRKKLERFKYLAVGAAVMFLAFVCFAVYGEWWISRQLEALNFEMEELRACDTLVPQLNKLVERSEHQQRMLAPFIEMGGRSKVFMNTVRETAGAMGKGDWCIYITDEFSHKDYGTRKEEDEKAESKKAAPAKSGFFGVSERDGAGKEQDRADENKVFLSGKVNMPLLGSMIIGGYAAVPGNKRFETILAIQNKLKGCGMFSEGVDWLDETREWTGREEQVSQSWNAYLRNQKAVFGEYTEFKLKLPLKNRSVEFPRVEPETKKKKKKQG